MPIATTDEARRAVWDRLQQEGVARFPFPPHGRIPNSESSGPRDHDLEGGGPL